MQWYEIIVLVLYTIGLAYLFFYSLGQLHLTIKYLHARKSKISAPPQFYEFPAVTIQLPVFNEKYVIERLIDSVCKIDYPLDRLEIQVLDDSTDETTDIATEIKEDQNVAALIVIQSAINAIAIIIAFSM